MIVVLRRDARKEKKKQKKKEEKKGKEEGLGGVIEDIIICFLLYPQVLVQVSEFCLNELPYLREVELE